MLQFKAGTDINRRGSKPADGLRKTPGNSLDSLISGFTFFWEKAGGNTEQQEYGCKIDPSRHGQLLVAEKSNGPLRTYLTRNRYRSMRKKFDHFSALPTIDDETYEVYRQ